MRFYLILCCISACELINAQSALPAFFGYLYIINVTVNLKLPDKVKIDKLPADKSIDSPDKSAIVFRILKKENNNIIITLGFRQTTTLVDYDQYAALKTFYTQITDLLNDPVILKVGN